VLDNIVRKRAIRTITLKQKTMNSSPVFAKSRANAVAMAFGESLFYSTLNSSSLKADEK
jgi:hypothetical protein